MNLTRTLLVPVLLISLTSCAGELSSKGDGGAGSGGSGGGGGGPVACAGSGGSGGASPLATFANVREIIDNTCYGSDCHREGEREPIMIAADPVAAPISDATLYKKLTTYVTAKCGKRVLVKPCAPDQSAFYVAQAGTCGDLAQMPFGCEPVNDNCTAMDKLEGIRQWIAKGAPGP